MTNPNTSNTPTKHYFIDHTTLTVIVTDNFDDGADFVYLGASNNPKPKMAVAAFTHHSEITSGYSIRVL